jgi:hypothetical protein
VVVDVAVEAAQDMISTPSEMDQYERPHQRCYSFGAVTIGSKDIVLQHTVPKAAVKLRLSCCAACSGRGSRRRINRIGAWVIAQLFDQNQGNDSTPKLGSICAPVDGGEPDETHHSVLAALAALAGYPDRRPRIFVVQVKARR